MATEIRVPTLGESVTEATIGKWFKKVGDAVAADEPLVELETDKVTVSSWVKDFEDPPRRPCARARSITTCLEEREKRGINDVYLLRVEQLDPFPAKALINELSSLPRRGDGVVPGGAEKHGRLGLH